MNIRSTQPRRARMGLAGLTIAALSFIALPGAVGAQAYPPGGGGGQLPPPPPEQLPPPAVTPPAGGVAGAGGAVTRALPATGGSDPAQILWIASSALLAGVVISGVSLRRRNAENALS
jgi:hypothetical protein